MCGRSSMMGGSGFFRGREDKQEAISGLTSEDMSPKARIMSSMSVLGPVVLSGIFLVVFVPQLWWIFTTYGWVSFPAFGQLTRGIAGMASSPSRKQLERDSSEEVERELLRALQDHGDLTPARAAIQTSLSVHEADEKLRGLAEGGYLEVRVYGGGLFYALWGTGDDARKKELS